MGIYFSVPVWLLLPEPYADLGQGVGQCCCGASMESVCGEMQCADTVIGGQVRGLAPSQKKSCLRVCV